MLRIAGLLVAASALSAAAGAAVPKNALGAVAVSPDGAMVVAAGDNRVLYVVDPSSLEVQARVLLGINPQEAVFSKDGATLAVWDTGSNITFYNVADWTVKAKVGEAEAIAVAPGADVIAALGYARGGSDGAGETKVTLYALSDGSTKAEGVIAAQAKSIAAAPDGAAFAVLTQRQDSEAEAKADTPQELSGLERSVFEQKHDGQVSSVVRLDGALKETGRADIWFSTYDQMIGAIDGETVWFAGYGNQNLKLTGDGEATLFAMAPGYLYGAGVAPDGKSIAGGSLRDGAILSLGDGSEKTFKLESLDGWPEYFEVFAFAPDGSVYGGTTAYRLIHVGADGAIKTAKPVF